ncbi:MarR family winged helix-turn-helix transcriptional regulator [Flammeovirga kamogawensis]|uniref:MarR family transcriptional regulator n=1 Tax=Flammeovirga kamogawensis TaxID=373891 RepID=A0ABX8GTP0_9BACT|nr:MarR family transcriptional regulator [Flammeovirga kamogawensis]MBB6462992.1 DNA-binding MarR family transcriptional regulator [Flammeovirga kamogawensis]QWG06517.1 MarR family transcriptional regulator [Flammeovirga kamogawensis]TRX68345.1 MarR family transcriptional regulator [Flammeovirga kamogawensis]
MSIETDINQKEFKTSFQKAYINLMFTNNWMLGKTKTWFKQHGITHQQYNVLRILRGAYPKCMNPGSIKEVMIDKSPDLTRLIDRLIEKGFVQRETCGSNRRKVDVIITDIGLEKLRELDPHQETIIETFKELTEEEASQLSDLLDKLRGSK